MLSERHAILAIDKKELRPANVEPFSIELMDPKPSHEKAMRYNLKLTKVVDEEIDALLG